MNLIATFPTLIDVEFKKSRHKHSLLLLAIAVLFNYFYLFHGNTPDQQAWYNVLYAIPLIDTLILSVLMAVSRWTWNIKAPCGISCRRWKAEHPSISASSSMDSST